MLTGAELGAYGEQVVAVGEVGGDQEREFRRVVFRNHVFIEFHYGFCRGVGQGDAYRLVLAEHFEVGSAHEEVASRCHGAVLQAGLAVFRSGDVHHVGFRAQDADRCQGDLFAHHFVLRESHIDTVAFGVPFAVFSQSQQAGHGVEQSGVELPAVHQQTGTNALEEGNRVHDRFETQSGVFGTHFFIDLVDVGFAGGFEYKDLVFRIGCHRVGCHPDF